MSLDSDELVARHPQLFHMAQAGSHAAILERGLLSTTALLDLFEVKGEQRAQIEREIRPESVTIEHSRYGTAVIRDNKPLRRGFLESCLQDGITVPDFCATLNGRVFFWLTQERLGKLLNARAYKKHAHDVFTIDTAALLQRHEDSVTLCRINSGSVLYPPPSAAPRGNDLFLPIEQYPHKQITELAVDYAVPDIAEMVVRVERRQCNEVLEVLL